MMQKRLAKAMDDRIDPAQFGSELYMYRSLSRVMLWYVYYTYTYRIMVLTHMVLTHIHIHINTVCSWAETAGKHDTEKVNNYYYYCYWLECHNLTNSLHNEYITITITNISITITDLIDYIMLESHGRQNRSSAVRLWAIYVSLSLSIGIHIQIHIVSCYGMLYYIVLCWNCIQHTETTYWKLSWN